MIGNLLKSVKPAEVLVVRCADVGEALGELETTAERETCESRFVVCAWQKLPKVSSIIGDALDMLAKAALALWPNWYGRSRQPGFENGIAAEDLLADLATIGALRDGRRDVLAPWLRASVARCRRGETPRPSGFADSIQAAQLALAIEPRQLLLLLCVTEEAPRSGLLYGLARAAEWLARETAAGLMVLIPAEIGEAGELDSINFNTVCFSGPEPAVAVEEKSRLLIWPFHGVPHPDSPGEQRLAQALGSDPALGGLFRFNQSVRTMQGHRYTVDLLWPEGKVAVEVDGYRWHSDPWAFRHDRQRDFEMLVSGYLTLRLPHTEVMSDVATAVEKIRDVVVLRRHPLSTNGANS